MEQALEDILKTRAVGEKISGLNAFVIVMGFAYKFNGITVSNAIKDLRVNQQPFYRTVDRLVEFGLLKIEVSDRSKNYLPTEIGRDVGSLCWGIVEVLVPIC